MATNNAADAPLIYFVSGNENKVMEMQEFLEEHPQVKVKFADLPEYQGEPGDVIRMKCLAARGIVNGPVIVEDTCLCFNALGGMPGPYVKWFLRKIGASGLYHMLDGFQDKSAYAICSFGYNDGRSDEVVVVQGRVDGTIVEPVGATHFGWDPCFMPDGSYLSFAQMSRQEKGVISHRGRALVKLSEFLESMTKDKKSNE